MNPHLPPISLASVIVAVLLAAAGGCASSEGIQKRNLQEGKLATFDAPMARVVEATRQSMMELKLGINTDKALDDDRHMLVGEIGVSAFSYGEVVRALIERAGETDSTVRVVTQRKLALNLIAKGDWSKDIFAKVRQKLGAVGIDDERSDR